MMYRCYGCSPIAIYQHEFMKAVNELQDDLRVLRFFLPQLVQQKQRNKRVLMIDEVKMRW